MALSFKGKIAAALLAVAMLGGCGEKQAGTNPLLSAMGSLKAGLGKGKAAAEKGEGKGANPAKRRAQLEEMGQPILRVSSKTLGQTGFLKVIDAKGPVLTWSTPDGATFSQRNGVLIQTRGLGADLMSAQAPSVGQLMQPGKPYQRIYYFLGPDDQGTRRTYDCATAIVGRDSIEVVGRTHATTHVTETCTRARSKLTNEFWIEGSTIRQSREWVSAGIGHVEFARVID